MLHTVWDMIQSMGNGDVWDWYWYNNYTAAGNQMYPEGLYKYFDMDSGIGWFWYILAWTWIAISNWSLIFTFGLPLDIWVNILFDNASWDSMWKYFLIFVPWFFGGVNILISMFFHMTVEDGWGMLSN